MKVTVENAYIATVPVFYEIEGKKFVQFSTQDKRTLILPDGAKLINIFDFSGV